jgi:hypothetical protein
MHDGIGQPPREQLGVGLRHRARRTIRIVSVMSASTGTAVVLCGRALPVPIDVNRPPRIEVTRCDPYDADRLPACWSLP